MTTILQATNRPPKRFHRLSSDRLQISEGGGGISLFGLPFLAAGIFLLLAATGLVRFDNADDISGWERPLLSLMAVAFSSVGAGLLFGRKWYTIDRGRGTLVVARGLLIPMIRKEHNLRLYSTVRLDHEAGDSDSPDRFPVSLHGSPGAPPIILANSHEYGQAREQAAFLVEFLGWPLEDATTDHAVKLAPTELRQSFQERSRQDIDPLATVGQPLHMKSRVDRGNGQLTISIPFPKRLAATLISGAIPLIFMVYIGSSFLDVFGESDTPQEIKLFFVAFAALFLLFPLLGVVRALINSHKFKTVVALNHSTMTIKDSGKRRNKTINLSLGDILDIDFGTKESIRSAIKEAARQKPTGRQPVDPRLASGRLSPGLVKLFSILENYIPAKGITVKSTQGLHSFGTGLPDDEIRYLHYLLREFVSRR